MIFFYVGIGFAMLTTVASIFQTSISINSSQYQNKPKSIDLDKVLIQKQNDKKFLQLLDDIKGRNLGSGIEICQNIKNGFTNELDINYSILAPYSVLNNYNSGVSSFSSNPRIKNGCNLIFNSHRIVIVPSSQETNTYNLYSCIVNIEPKCFFELVD
tara:strand:+ start:287 stop:757 length:471 start_codon:yes stop_codon:yes gene_type:complete